MVTMMKYLKMIHIIKKILCLLFYYLGMVRLLIIFHHIIKGHKLLIVFTFHRVTDYDQSKKFLLKYDRGIDYKIHELQIKIINKYCKTLSIEEYVNYITGQKQLTQNSALITYDDGDYDFTKYALPALRKYNSKATIFVPTDFIELDKKFWHLEISNLFYYINEDSWSLIVENNQFFPKEIQPIIEKTEIDTVENRKKHCISLIIAMNKLPQKEIDDSRDKMLSLAGLKYKLPIKCMNWSELKELTNYGIDIESHTKTHRKLSHLDDAEIYNEALVSKQEIEQNLKNEVLTICYPAGSYNEPTLDIVEKAKYKAAFSSHPGLDEIPVKGKDLYRLRRNIIYGNSMDGAAFCIGKITLTSIRS